MNTNKPIAYGNTIYNDQIKPLRIISSLQIYHKFPVLYVISGESIKTANEQITECKKELEEAKTIRKNRQGDGDNF